MKQGKISFGIEKAAIEEMQCRAETMRDNIINFWQERCEDKEYGGFLTNFDSEGKDLGTPEKYLNTQCRFIWTFSSLLRTICFVYGEVVFMNPIIFMIYATSMELKYMSAR